MSNIRVSVSYVVDDIGMIKAMIVKRLIISKTPVNSIRQFLSDCSLRCEMLNK